jgi:hypothetical protein
MATSLARVPARQGIISVEHLVEKVRMEIARYEHPLFDFSARSANEGVEVLIDFKPQGVEVHRYVFLLRPREIENKQFPWSFQKQLYDCLHDYVIERFTLNPQRDDT